MTQRYYQTSSITIERRRRGVVGKLALAVFLVWQAIFVYWFLSYLVFFADHVNAQSDEFGAAGAVIGGTLAASLILGIWFFGSVVLGLAAFLTRGKREFATRYEAAPMPGRYEGQRPAGTLLRADPADRPQARR